MKKIDRLKREALEACKWRGHDMCRFRHHDYYKDTIAFSHCRKCAMQVVVNSCPMPNDIEIGGEAVALGCRSAK